MSKENSLKATAERIKDKVTFKDYAQKARISGYVCPCCHSGSPDKIDGTGSGAVSEGREPGTWFCHKAECGAGGDVLDYVAYELNLKTKGRNISKEDFPKVIDECCRRFNVTPCGDGAIPFEGYVLPAEKLTDVEKYKQDLKPLQRPSQTREEPRYEADDHTEVKSIDKGEENATAPDFSAYIEKCAEQLEDYPEALDYLKKRGISLKTAKVFKIGYDAKADTAKNKGQFVNNNHSAPRMIIPSGTSFYTARSIDENPYRYLNAGSPGLFGSSLLSALSDNDIVYVCEGGFDAMSVYEANGQPVVALHSKGNGYLLLEAIKEQGLSGKHFVILLDNDKGEEKRNEVHKTADILMCDILRTGNYATVCDICLSCSEVIKDTNDFLVQDAEAFKSALKAASEDHWATYKDFNPEILTNPAGTPSSFVCEEEKTLAEFGDTLTTFDDFANNYDKVTPNRIKSGVAWIDDIFGGGLERGSLIVVMAPPGTGKTSLVQTIMERLADNKQPGRFIELEMSFKQVVSKSLSMRLFTKNPNAPVKIGWSDIYEREHLTEKNITKDIPGAFKDYRSTALPYLRYLCDMRLKDVERLRTYLLALGERSKQLGVSAPCVCMDYLQLCKSSKAKDTQELITDVVMTLKDYALKYDTVAFCISAVNRESMKNGQISLTSGRDSSAIEFSADTVYALNHWVVDQGIIEPQATSALLEMQRTEKWLRLVVKQVKSRMNYAKKQETKLYFNGEYSTFYEADDPYIPYSEDSLMYEFEKPQANSKYTPKKKGVKARETI